MKVFVIFLLSMLVMSGCAREDDDAPLPSSHAAQAAAQPRIVADGWTPNLSFDLPDPGTYTLTTINTAGGGILLDTEGEEVELDSLLGDKIVLLTFIYSSCTDLNGCPLATAVFYKVKERFKDNPELADKIRLISISFDPEHDTPEVMKLYGAGFEGGKPEWIFLTSASEKALRPITQQYGQMVIKAYDENGEYTGSMAHVLRAFLIDHSKSIRQEYSVSFLHDQLVTRDIHTLLIEDGTIDMDVIK